MTEEKGGITGEKRAMTEEKGGMTKEKTVPDQGEN